MRPGEPFDYCWCGHLRSGHTVNAFEKDKPQMCGGEDLLQRDTKPCDCPKFVPVEVATFRMLDQMSKHLIDFKMVMATSMQILLQNAEEEKNRRAIDLGITH